MYGVTPWKESDPNHTTIRRLLQASLDLGCPGTTAPGVVHIRPVSIPALRIHQFPLYQPTSSWPTHLPVATLPTYPSPVSSFLVFAQLLEYNAGGHNGALKNQICSRMEASVGVRVTDVEQLKTKVRRLAAGRVLAGDSADVCLELAQLDACRASIAAGYGSLSQTPQVMAGDRLLWILDGFAQVHDAAGRVTHLSQGESTVLAGGTACRLVFPQLTLYLLVEPREQG
jgi:hypothetical protein